MAPRNPTAPKPRKRKSNTWKDIDQSVKPKAMSSASERRIWLGRLKVAGVALVVAAVAFGALQLSKVVDKGPELLTKAGESMPIRSIEIETDGSLEREWLLDYMDVGEEENLLSVDLSELKGRLERIGQVRSAEIERRFPDALVVSIQERVPMARLLAQRSNGQKLLLFVDEVGVVFEGEHIDSSFARTLPFLDGVSLKKEGERFANIEGIEPVATLLSEARAIAPHIYSRWQVVSLEKQDRVIAKGAAAKQVIFDSAGDFRNQLGRLDFILDYYRSTRIGKIDHVDLTLGEQVPVTL